MIQRREPSPPSRAHVAPWASRARPIRSGARRCSGGPHRLEGATRRRSAGASPRRRREEGGEDGGEAPTRRCRRERRGVVLGPAGVPTTTRRRLAPLRPLRRPRGRRARRARGRGARRVDEHARRGETPRRRATRIPRAARARGGGGARGEGRGRARAPTRTTRASPSQRRRALDDESRGQAQRARAGSSVVRREQADPRRERRRRRRRASWRLKVRAPREGSRSSAEGRKSANRRRTPGSSVAVPRGHASATAPARQRRTSATAARSRGGAGRVSVVRHAARAGLRTRAAAPARRRREEKSCDPSGFLDQRQRSTRRVAHEVLHAVVREPVQSYHVDVASSRGGARRAIRHARTLAHAITRTALRNSRVVGGPVVVERERLERSTGSGDDASARRSVRVRRGAVRTGSRTSRDADEPADLEDLGEGLVGRTASKKARQPPPTPPTGTPPEYRGLRTCTARLRGRRGGNLRAPSSPGRARRAWHERRSRRHELKRWQSLPMVTPSAVERHPSRSRRGDAVRDARRRPLERGGRGAQGAEDVDGAGGVWTSRGRAPGPSLECFVLPRRDDSKTPRSPRRRAPGRARTLRPQPRRTLRCSRRYKGGDRARRENAVDDEYDNDEGLERTRTARRASGAKQQRAGEGARGARPPPRGGESERCPHPRQPREAVQAPPRGVRESGVPRPAARRGGGVPGHCVIAPIAHGPSSHGGGRGRVGGDAKFQGCNVLFVGVQGESERVSRDVHEADDGVHGRSPPRGAARDGGSASHPRLGRGIGADVLQEGHRRGGERVEHARLEEVPEHGAAQGAAANRSGGFPYFHVEFDASQKGFAHVIDDETRWRNDFGRDVLCGLLDLPPNEASGRKETLNARAAVCARWTPS